MALEEKEVISDGRLLVRTLVVLALTLVGFVLHSALHVEPAIVALLGAGLAVTMSGLSTSKYLADVEWETLVFFAGLFIMVGALVEVGVIGQLGSLATEAVGDQYLGAAVGLVVGSAVISAIVDNIPFVTTMSPLVAGLIESSGNHPQAQSLWWALALGADLGGNATAVGASANVVVTGIAARNGHPISFWTFTRYGLVVTAVTIALTIPYVVLRYYT